jgi:hypothetical protein
MRIFIFLLLLLESIKCFGQINKEEAQHQLLGNWNWLKTETIDRGGGGIATPISCNCTKRLTFLEGIVNSYINDSLKVSFDYYLDEYESLNNPTKIIIHGKFLTGQVIFWSDTVGIGPFGGCGSIEYYVKNNNTQH